MSELLTIASIKGVAGWSEWGRLTRAEIIQKTREFYQHRKEEAEKILAASDDDFYCRVVRGPRVQRLVERLDR